MRRLFTSSIMFAAAILATFYLLPASASAQQEGAAPRGARAPRPPGGPTPRWADGHPDLGNSAGSWSPIVVPNIAGADAGGARQTKLVEKPVDVPFLPWAKEVYDQRNATLSKDDPESRCLPP